MSQSPLPVRSSTPIPIDAAGTSQASLTALESWLSVANTPGSQLPELLSTTQALIAVPTTGTLSDDDDDCETSVYEAPVLPIQEHKVRFLTDLSEVEKTTEELSSVGCPSLYGGIPGMSESGADQPDLTVLTQPHTEPVLVDIGERFPFYEDFVRGRTTPLINPESRASTQLCIVADYIQYHGDIALLRSMWAKISSFTDHQAALCDFDWGEERMTVSVICLTFLKAFLPFKFGQLLKLFSFSGCIPTLLQLCLERYCRPHFHFAVLPSP